MFLSTVFFHTYGAVAQLARRLSNKQEVMGSNPIGAWNLLLCYPCVALDGNLQVAFFLPFVWLNYKEYTITMKPFHVYSLSIFSSVF